MSQSLGKLRKKLVAEGFLILCALCALGGFVQAQESKSAPAKSVVTGRYEGTAKNAAGEVIQVSFELSEKEGAMSGMIRSDHGDFTITGGSHHGEEVTLEFDAGGPTGTINLKVAEDNLSGTWSTEQDGGPVEVKKATAGETRKEKSEAHS
jgi:hypothetical protein